MSDSVCSADQHQARSHYHRPHHRHLHQSHHHDRDGHHNNNPALRGDERGPAARPERSGPHRQPRPRRRSPSPSASSSCSSSGYRNEKALVPRARSARRGSVLSDAGESGPEEYTVYPDGRIHEHRRPRRRRRFGGKEGGGEWVRDRGRDEDRGGYDGFARGRKRSREEAKRFLLAALVVVAGVILCWD